MSDKTESKTPLIDAVESERTESNAALIDAVESEGTKSNTALLEAVEESEGREHILTERVLFHLYPRLSMQTN